MAAIPNTTANEVATEKSFFSNKTYDLLNDLVKIIFPAFVTFYSGMAVLWEWANTDRVVASAGLLITLLAVILKVSQSRFKAAVENTFDGEITVHPEGAETWPTITTPIAELEGRDTVTLKVVPSDGVG